MLLRGGWGNLALGDPPNPLVALAAAWSSTWDEGATPWELLVLTSASTLFLQVQGDLAVAGRGPAAHVCQAVGSVPGYQGGAEGAWSLPSLQG